MPEAITSKTVDDGRGGGGEGRPFDGSSSDSEVIAVLRLLAEPTRLQIMRILVTGGEMSVNELQRRLAMAQPTVSHHLRLLRVGQLLATRRDGQSILYSLSDRITVHVGEGMCEFVIEIRPGVHIRIQSDRSLRQPPGTA